MASSVSCSHCSAARSPSPSRILNPCFASAISASARGREKVLCSRIGPSGAAPAACRRYPAWGGPPSAPDGNTGAPPPAPCRRPCSRRPGRSWPAHPRPRRPFSTSGGPAPRCGGRPCPHTAALPAWKVLRPGPVRLPARSSGVRRPTARPEQPGCPVQLFLAGLIGVPAGVEQAVEQAGIQRGRGRPRVQHDTVHLLAVQHFLHGVHQQQLRHGTGRRASVRPPPFSRR